MFGVYPKFGVSEYLFKKPYANGGIDLIDNLSIYRYEYLIRLYMVGH